MPNCLRLGFVETDQRLAWIINSLKAGELVDFKECTRLEYDRKNRHASLLRCRKQRWQLVLGNELRGEKIC